MCSAETRKTGHPRRALGVLLGAALVVMTASIAGQTELLSESGQARSGASSICHLLQRRVPRSQRRSSSSGSAAGRWTRTTTLIC
jgi:hypothetical protein